MLRNVVRSPEISTGKKIPPRPLHTHHTEANHARYHLPFKERGKKSQTQLLSMPSNVLKSTTEILIGQP